jgi:hypothetical protein
MLNEIEAILMQRKPFLTYNFSKERLQVPEAQDLYDAFDILKEHPTEKNKLAFIKAISACEEADVRGLPYEKLQNAAEKLDFSHHEKTKVSNIKSAKKS